MEKLKLKMERFSKALGTLEWSLNDLSKIDPDEHHDRYLAMQDSVIKRFEYCHELFWKFLKFYLQMQVGIVIEGAGSRKVFNLARDEGLLSESEFEICLGMIEKRNLSSHTYDDEMADEVAGSVSPYFEVMKRVLDKLSQSIS